MSRTVRTTIWALDAIRCALAQKAFEKGYRAIGRNHVRRVAMLRKKAKSLQQ